MPSPPGYNKTSKGRKGGTTRIPVRKIPSGGGINGGMKTTTSTLNGSPAATRIARMKPRKKTST